MARINIANQHIEDHGILIDAESLERVSKYTEKVYRGYIQLSYDSADGVFFADYFPDENHWVEYKSRSCFGIGKTTRHVSMQALVDTAHENLQMMKQYGLL